MMIANSHLAWLFTQQATALRFVVGFVLIALGLRKLMVAGKRRS